MNTVLQYPQYGHAGRSKARYPLLLTQFARPSRNHALPTTTAAAGSTRFLLRATNSYTHHATIPAVRPCQPFQASVLTATNPFDSPKSKSYVTLGHTGHAGHLPAGPPRWGILCPSSSMDLGGFLASLLGPLGFPRDGGSLAQVQVWTWAIFTPLSLGPWDSPAMRDPLPKSKYRLGQFHASLPWDPWDPPAMGIPCPSPSIDLGDFLAFPLGPLGSPRHGDPLPKSVAGLGLSPPYPGSILFFISSQGGM